nr:importin subunit alpha-1 isoform X2 [Parasteatoda tepidariorum]
MDNGLVGLVIDVLHKGDYDSQKEAIRAVRSITSGGTIEQIMFLVGGGVIPPVCNLLAYQDAEILTEALEAIANILNAATKFGETKNVCFCIKQCGSLDKIENLQQHVNTEVHKSAVTIIDYFTGECSYSF